MKALVHRRSKGKGSRAFTRGRCTRCYVGVDASKATSQITVVDEAGKVLKRMRVANSREGLQAMLGRYRRPMKAVLEASYSWGPMYDWLDELTDEVVLAHPGKVRAIAEARIKTDTIDSETALPASGFSELGHGLGGLQTSHLQRLVLALVRGRFCSGRRAWWKQKSGMMVAKEGYSGLRRARWSGETGHHLSW